MMSEFSVRSLLCKLLLLSLVLVILPHSQAIIIRHDKNYSSYQVRESEYPAVFFLAQSGNRKVCVATVIDVRWAITAAHCALETGLQESLDSGRSFSVKVAGKERVVEQLVIHPDYQPDTAFEVDMALLRFSQAQTLPIPIRLNQDEEELGRSVSLLGWGYFGLGTTGRQYDDGRFRMAENRIESSGRRLRIRFDDPRDANAQALDQEGMPGLGDSGGPALLRDGDSWLLAGIAVGELVDDDFSEETQGSYGSVAIYERVSRHLPWIRRTIEGIGPAADN